MLQLTWPILLLIYGVFFMGSFAQGLTGFGFGVVAMALLPLLLPVKTATPYVSAVNTFICIQLFWALRHCIQWRAATPMIVGMVIGIPFGVQALVYFPEPILKRLLGLYLIGIAAHGIFVPRKPSPPPDARPSRRTLAFPFAAGIASGGLGAIFNIGGPPLISFVYRQPWTQQEMNATLQAVFLLSCTLRLSAYAYRGLLDLSEMALLLPSLPLLFIGAALGQKCVVRTDPKKLRLVIYVVIGIMGLKFL